MKTQTAISLEELEFDPPSPGAWEIDNVHYPRPACRFTTALFEEPFHRGFEESLRRYGVLVRYPEYRFVNGFAYHCARPAPEEEIPERLANAARACEAKLWREDMRRWDEEVKPEAIRGHLALQAVDPRQLDDEGLIDHLATCVANFERGLERHHQFNAATLVPTGDFLVQGSELSGVSPAELLVLLRGSAPASAGESDGLQGLAAAIRGDDQARALLDDDDPSGVLDSLVSHPGEIGRAAAAYLEMVGCRLLDGFEICDPIASEKPELLVRTIRQAVETGPEADEDAQARLAAVRDRVAGGDRERFDELLAEARHTYRLRDERGIYNDGWATGITRRAVIAAGQRLTDRGRIEQPSHLAEAEFEEIVALLRGNGGRPASELAARAAFRSAYTAADAPQALGDPPSPPPPVDDLPPPAARVMRAIGVTLEMLFGSSEAENSARMVRGIPASPGIYEGVARHIAGPHELDRLVEGDILVTPSTSEAFNIVLPMLGAIVTDAGGLLSHAAIVSREFGIPGVVGSREATRLIPDGARVRVDGASGEVAVLS